MTDYTLLHGDIFPFPTIKTNYNKIPNINAGLDAIFSSDRVRKWDLLMTTCTVPRSLADLLAIPEIDDLMTWIKQCILDNASHLGKPNAKTVMFTAGWANRFFKGSQNNCHLHLSSSNGCAIFYQDVPQPNSSDLVLVRGGKDETPLNSYEKKDCFRINVATGDLIMHHISIPHGISRHKNNNPRTCIIFNFVLN